MAIIVKKLEGDEIPASLREANTEYVFQVTDDNGNAHYVRDDVEAAKLAVELSNQGKADY